MFRDEVTLTLLVLQARFLSSVMTLLNCSPQPLHLLLAQRAKRGIIYKLVLGPNTSSGPHFEGGVLLLSKSCPLVSLRADTRTCKQTDSYTHIFLLPTAREGNVFTRVCHSVHNRSHGYSVTAHPCYSVVGMHSTGMLSCVFIINRILFFVPK